MIFFVSDLWCMQIARKIKSLQEELETMQVELDDLEEEDARATGSFLVLCSYTSTILPFSLLCCGYVCVRVCVCFLRCARLCVLVCAHAHARIFFV